MSEPRAVLAIDLCTARGALAVVRGGTVVFAAHFIAERSHNAELFAPLSEALSRVEGDLGAIVVGTGPGSYTGVRIAIAAAQGVALAATVPVIGLPSIGAADTGAARYRFIGDARRGLFYTAEIVEGECVAPLKLSGAEAAKREVESSCDAPWLTFDPRPPACLPQVALTHPDPARLARQALRFSRDEIERLAASPLEPIYLQDPFITQSKRIGKMPAV